VSIKLLLKVLNLIGKRSLAILSLPLLVGCERLFKFLPSQQETYLEFKDYLGSKPLRVAVYAVYPANTKDTEIELVINALNKLNYFVFLVINSDEISSFQSKASAHLIRGNRGRDLSAYREALLHLKGRNIIELLLLNDSCHWHENGIIDAVECARELDYEVSSITISEQRIRHLQTYFLHIKPQAIRAISEIFETRIKDWRFKRSIVTFGELNLTKWLEARGLKCGALLSETSAVKNLEKSRTPTLDEKEAIYLIEKGIHVNPSQYFWKILWDDFGIVKKSLINENPLNLITVPESIEKLPARD
jgi:hypothetical protein